jgi:hypothetical protein
MHGQCTVPGCGKTFNTKDGGSHCDKCGLIACPDCEEEYFDEGETTCKGCKASIIENPEISSMTTLGLVNVTIQFKGKSAADFLQLLAASGLNPVEVRPAAIDFEYEVITFVGLTKKQADDLNKAAAEFEFTYSSSDQKET